MPKYTTEQRNNLFWDRVAIGSENDCWVWLGGKDKDGYGKTSFHHKTIRSHRFAYQITFGEIDNDLHVLHSCDNPQCVNPKHLFLGTSQDNMTDCVNKGRHKTSYGEDHGRHKLTKLQVIAIREEHNSGLISQRKLARKYNVTFQNIHRIVTFKSWKEM